MVRLLVNNSSWRPPGITATTPAATESHTTSRQTKPSFGGKLLQQRGDHVTHPQSDKSSGRKMPRYKTKVSSSDLVPPGNSRRRYGLISYHINMICYVCMFILSICLLLPSTSAQLNPGKIPVIHVL